MNAHELMRKLESVIDRAKAGVLTTVDEQGHPQARWMTPSVLRGRPEALYAVTSPHSSKVAHLRANPDASWLIQTPSLTEVLTLHGVVNVIDNPALNAEVLELIGDRLRVFWKVNPERMEIVVLETVLREAEYFLPMRGSRETITFTEGTA